MADQHSIPRQARDLTGQHFTRWTVLSFAGRDDKGKLVWLCRCDCGTERIVRGTYLIDGDTQSCGCLNRDSCLKRFTTHNCANAEAETPEYRVWKVMKGRCHNPKHANFHKYGARGIVVCERWRESFAAFLEDMGPRPSAQHSIDRIDNSGPYESANCRWATREEQANNRRDNHLITCKGKTQTLAQWVRETGISRQTIIWRLAHQWSVEDTLSTPTGN